jgi:hypothetical protein
MHHDVAAKRWGLFRVGEVQPRFNAIKAKLRASFNALETQKVSFEAVEIFAWENDGTVFPPFPQTLGIA